MEKEKLTKEQEAKIYCIKHGHANYIFNCCGYVHCGRCGEQIGDRLGGMFDLSATIVIGCKEKDCKVCPPLIEKLSPMDKKIFDILQKNHLNNTYLKHEEILEGINFEE